MRRGPCFARLIAAHSFSSTRGKAVARDGAREELLLSRCTGVQCSSDLSVLRVLFVTPKKNWRIMDKAQWWKDAARLLRVEGLGLKVEG